MSLDSYKKAIEAQRKREHEYEHNFPQHKYSIDREPEQKIRYYERPKKRKFGIVTIIIFTISIILLAALTNPSNTNAKTEIISLIKDKFIEKMREDVNNDDNSASKQFGASLMMTLFNLDLLNLRAIDFYVNTDVSNYIFFSTFNTQVTIKEENKTLVSGVIIFGKVIPLKSDFKKEFLE